MMSGCVDGRVHRKAPASRVYQVVARDGGWSISLNGLCTRPFRNRKAAERIARTLQRQADALTDCSRRRTAIMPEPHRSGREG